MEPASNNKEKPKKLKLDFKDSKYSTGRRKKSIAKVWVKKGTGKIFVNGKLMGDYFKRPVHQLIVTRPLEISNVILIPQMRPHYVHLPLPKAKNRRIRNAESYYKNHTSFFNL